MNNLERIKAAWAIGWSAIIVFDRKEFAVLSIFDEFLGLRLNTDGTLSNLAIIEKQIEITGYLYAGQLAGNEPIPEV